MNLQKKVEQMAQVQKVLIKRIAHLEAERKPKRKSNYKCKIKMTHVPSKAEIHQRIDNRFLKKMKAA